MDGIDSNATKQESYDDIESQLGAHAGGSLFTTGVLPQSMEAVSNQQSSGNMFTFGIGSVSMGNVLQDAEEVV